MTPDREEWAVAAKYIEIYGDRAPGQAAERFRELAASGYKDGAAKWLQISRKISALLARPDQATTRQ